MEELQKAIQLRNSGNLKESNQLLLNLVKNYPDDAVVNYQCAWSYDALGEESRAVPYYVKAINLGLTGKDLEGAYLGLGSTYRTLGEYQKSKEIFSKGIQVFPENKALQVFFSMTLYNLKEHERAMELLLNCLIETTSDENILNYERAISFYSDKLDKVWK